MRTATAEAWADALAREINERRRAECMARIQSDAVQLAHRPPRPRAGHRGISFASSSKRSSRSAKATPAASGCSKTTPRARRRATSGWRRSRTDSSPGARRLGIAGAAEREHVRAPPRLSSPAGPRSSHYEGDDPRLPESRPRLQHRERHRLGPRRAARAADAQPRMVRVVVRPGPALRWRLASSPPRRDGAPGDAGAAPKPARRTEPFGGASAGGSRGAQPARA